MLHYYFNLSPNPMKVALFLEESGIAFEPHPVDTRKGEQFAADFLKLNPNGKVPAIRDGDTVVFDSNAILLYLGEKTGQFMPQDAAQRGELLSWLMFVATGVGPFFGQQVHFKHFAPEPVPYAQNRYAYEAERHLGVLDQRLASRRYMLGDEYTIVDMAVWGWGRMIAFLLGDDAPKQFANVQRLVEEIGARPAAQRASAWKDKYQFKAQLDDDARKIMFPHNARLKAAE